ncbi:MAG: hypothetical protein ACI8P3_001793 [Saprospiraceae bacterium]|jgi:hypothetical protein
MKLKIIFSCFCLFLTLVSLQAQCPKATTTSETPFDASILALGVRTEVADVVWGGEYVLINNVTPGTTYTFDDCGATYDSNITVYKSTNNDVVGFNNGGCGDDGTFQTVIPAGVTSLFFQVNVDPCAGNAANTSLYMTLDMVAPVELVRFYATLIADLVELKWETASELNNEGFQLERSIDGEKWDNIAFISGRGTTTELQIYKHIDANPLNGVNYYRLKQMDFDGQFEYSSIVSVKVERDNNNFSLFPNPAHGAVTLALETSFYGEEVSFTLYDLGGRQVKTQVLTLEGDYFRTNIDLTGVPAGVYLTLLQMGSKKWQEKLVVK